MLKRLFFILVICVATPIATQANANPFSDSVVLQLKKQGYGEVRVGRTLLGRIRIIAIGADNRREVIVHPITGEILRDYSRRIAQTDDGEGSASGGNEQSDTEEYGDDHDGNGDYDGDDDHDGNDDHDGDGDDGNDGDGDND